MRVFLGQLDPATVIVTCDSTYGGVHNKVALPKDMECIYTDCLECYDRGIASDAYKEIFNIRPRSEETVKSALELIRVEGEYKRVFERVHGHATSETPERCFYGCGESFLD